MKIALMSDTHRFPTKEWDEAYREVCAEVAGAGVDLIVDLGDYSGNCVKFASEDVEASVVIRREIVGDVATISTIGNHDLWVTESDQILADFRRNRDKIAAIFKEHGIHFLDEDGVYRRDGLTFFGCMGWYKSPQPPTNDADNIPPMLGTGTAHQFLLTEANRSIRELAESLRGDPSVLVACTHFPLFAFGDDPVQIDFHDRLGWDRAIGRWLQEDIGVKYFLSGHSHKRQEGPIHFNCGSHLNQPRAVIFDLIWA